MDIDKWLIENSDESANWTTSIEVIPVTRIHELLETHVLVPKESVGQVEAMIRVDWENTENTKVIALIDKDKNLAPGTKLYAAQENS